MLSATAIDSVVVPPDGDAWPARVSDRSAFLAEMAALGPACSAVVYVNGRPLLLEGALRLVQQLPDDAVASRRHRYVTVSPDPFPAPPLGTRPRPGSSDIPPTAELVQRLRESQLASGRASEASAAIRPRRVAALLALAALLPVALLAGAGTGTPDAIAALLAFLGGGL